MIIPLYKPLGVSTHSFVKAYGEKIDEKVTHTGSLDPMAEGVVVVLTGKDRFKKEEMSDTDKEYEFEVLAGFQTDSWDVLGLVENHLCSSVLDPESTENLNHDSNTTSREVQDAIVSVLPQFIGEYDQVIPKFSAKRINGESYFDKAKRGEEWETETQSVAVYTLISLDNYLVASESLYGQIKEKINKVEGDFRQEEVLTRWNEVLSEQSNLSTSHSGQPSKSSIYEVIRFRAITSRRFYIRGLVRDISTKLNIPMTTWSIVRTHNGEYGIEDCKLFTGSCKD